MKNFKTLLFITLMSSFCLTAQNDETKKADKHFARYEFVKAAEDYTKLVENGKGDAYVYAQLAESYYNIFNTVEAERWYAKTLETSETPEMIYKYSQMLKANGKYAASNTQMAKFASMRPADHRAIGRYCFAQKPRLTAPLPDPDPQDAPTDINHNVRVALY
jgi:tetratricopeptide (TPR) repeat protein